MAYGLELSEIFLRETKKGKKFCFQNSVGTLFLPINNNCNFWVFLLPHPLPFHIITLLLYSVYYFVHLKCRKFNENTRSQILHYSLDRVLRSIQWRSILNIRPLLKSATMKFDCIVRPKFPAPLFLSRRYLIGRRQSITVISTVIIGGPNMIGSPIPQRVENDTEKGMSHFLLLSFTIFFISSFFFFSFFFYFSCSALLAPPPSPLFLLSLSVYSLLPDLISGKASLRLFYSIYLFPGFAEIKIQPILEE